MEEAFCKYPETRQFDHFRKSYLKGQPELHTLEFHGTIKIHGANISIIFTSPNSWQIQSRHRILSAEEDLYGCYATLNHAPLQELAEQILQLESKSSNKEGEWRDIMVVGEWAGKGIQARVGV